MSNLTLLQLTLCFLFRDNADMFIPGHACTSSAILIFRVLYQGDAGEQQSQHLVNLGGSLTCDWQ